MTTPHPRAATLRSSVRVAHPAHEVAAYVLDWSHDPQWRAHVRGFTCEPAGRAVVGQQLVEDLRFAGLTFRTPTEVTDADHLTASYSGGSGPVQVRGTRTVTPIDADSCVVTTTTHVRLTRGLQLLAPVLTPAYRSADAADVRRLPEVLDRVLGRRANELSPSTEGAA